MKAILTAIGLCLSGATALACPTAADLKTGIFLTLDDGGTELHKQTRADWVQIFATFSDGEAALLDYYKGLYLHTDVPVVNGIPRLGETETYATLANIQKWTDPRPNAAWENPAPDGGTAKSSKARPFKVGGCTYPAFKIDMTFNDDPAYSETYQFLPTLGIALLTVSDDGVTKDRYKYTEIKSATP